LVHRAIAPTNNLPGFLYQNRTGFFYDLGFVRVCWVQEAGDIRHTETYKLSFGTSS